MLQGCLALVLIAVILTLGLAMCGRSSNPDSSVTSSNVDEGLVRVRFVRVCHEIISDQLKAPASAEWRNGLDEDEAITVSGDNLSLNSYVDAQNSFGALLRTNFTCSYTRATDTVSGKLL